VEIPALAGVTLVGTVTTGDAAANDVALAVSPVTGTETEALVGVTWLSACGAEGAYASRGSRWASTRAASPTRSPWTPSSRWTAPGLFRAPRIAYASRGFLAPDAQRGGVDVDGETGGWYIVWGGADSASAPMTSSTRDTAGTLYIDRVAAFDGEAVDGGGVITASATGVNDYDLATRVEDVAGVGPLERVFVRAATESALLGVPLTCH
jgi:hypothetical protein